MTLHEYSKNNGLNYSKAYRDYASGKVKGYKNEDGRIIIGDKPNQNNTNSSMIVIGPTPELPGEIGVYEERASDTRNNKAATIRPTDRYKHIDDSYFAYTSGSTGYDNSDVTIADLIILCQKCYAGFSEFRSSIDLMTEFCVGSIYFKDGNAKARKFFEGYWNKINIWKLQEQFYLELWRSSNVFIHRQDSKIQPEDIKKINQTYGFSINASLMLPRAYTILNPADIHAQASISFTNTQYYMVLQNYMLDSLRNPRTPEDKEVLESLDPQVQKQIKEKRQGIIRIPLDNKNIVAAFLKKQSYEPFAIPFGSAVLADINFKREMRLLDQAVMRHTQSVLLLITTGAPPDEGGINPRNIEKLQQLFTNQSSVRVIISDYTTKGQFLIPEISNIIDPKKYEVLNRDIAIGLGNILLGEGEKFANQNAKIEIFVEKLNQARQIFINEFLLPEIKRIAQNIGLRHFPIPFYEKIDLRNELEYAKIYARLGELGILTPTETIEAIETGRLPTEETSIENQEKFKDLRDKGLYKPLMTKNLEGEGSGRKAGSKSPKNRVTVGPIGAKENYSLAKIRTNILLSQEVEEKIINHLKQKHKLETLNNEQMEIVTQILNLIVTNENPENWLIKANEYIEHPTDTNEKRVFTVLEIAKDHQIETFLAGILLASTI